MSRIRPRERDTILQSLSAGVVPRRGHQHIQVGRSDEIQALMRDLDRITDEGAAIRFVIGRYGSGKTFFLHLIRSIALTIWSRWVGSRRLRAAARPSMSPQSASRR